MASPARALSAVGDVGSRRSAQVDHQVRYDAAPGDAVCHKSLITDGTQPDPEPRGTQQTALVCYQTAATTTTHTDVPAGSNILNPVSQVTTVPTSSGTLESAARMSQPLSTCRTGSRDITTQKLTESLVTPAGRDTSQQRSRTASKPFIVMPVVVRRNTHAAYPTENL